MALFCNDLALPFLESDMFSQYYIHSNACSRFNIQLHYTVVPVVEDPTCSTVFFSIILFLNLYL